MSLLFFLFSGKLSIEFKNDPSISKKKDWNFSYEKKWCGELLHFFLELSSVIFKFSGYFQVTISFHEKDCVIPRRRFS